MSGLRFLKHRWRTARARADIRTRLEEPPLARPHGLPWPLVVSLTSYPARFQTLALTLGALLTQTVRPDATILWLARGDEAALPPEVTALRGRGLEIALTEDLRSFKKIVPTLAAHPGAAVVTADDDVFYDRTWLAGLIAGAEAQTVPCHRANRMLIGQDGAAMPYETWEQRLLRAERGPLLVPTGVLGALYEPGSLHEEVGRADLFLELCPSSDDLWLWWMHRLAGWTAAQVGGRMRILEWPGSQGSNLRSVNTEGAGNDRAVAALTARYGLPVTGG